MRQKQQQPWQQRTVFPGKMNPYRKSRFSSVAIVMSLTLWTAFAAGRLRSFAGSVHGVPGSVYVFPGVVFLVSMYCVSWSPISLLLLFFRRWSLHHRAFIILLFASDCETAHRASVFKAMRPGALLLHVMLASWTFHLFFLLYKKTAILGRYLHYHSTSASWVIHHLLRSATGLFCRLQHDF